MSELHLSKGESIEIWQDEKYASTHMLTVKIRKNGTVSVINKDKLSRA
jgi:hypothetical protein